MRRFLAPLALGLALAGLAQAMLAQEATRPLVALEVGGSPLVPDRGGKLKATVRLSEPAKVRVRAVDFDGRTMRLLADGEREVGEFDLDWLGRDAGGEPVPRGPYRIVASATAASDGRVERADGWITVADRAVYPEAPRFITIAVDPGHGGDYDGAVAPDGTREADLNLDIGLRLARMLEGAGVNVVITRRADAQVNVPPEDRTGDGVIDGDDELAARPDLANAARADLFLSIHNNTAVNESVGGPSTFYFDERSFGARSERLAMIVQAEMVAALTEVAGGTTPHDHGALIYPYYVLRGFDPPRLQRPTQMPGVLSEGMFLSHPGELALLQQPTVRAAMAVAYFDAVSKYLARRGDHIGYELVEAPSGTVPAADHVVYRVAVRNQGTKVIEGWRLKVTGVAAPERYVSRIRDALTVGEAEIPRLKPGESRVLEVGVTAPGPGEWTLLFDARDSEGTRAAELGSPMLQVDLSVTEVEPTLGPSPSATASQT